MRNGQQIIIAGEILLPPERRAECLAASVPLQEATRREEPGCLAYVFAADPVRPDVIAVYERWADGASLAAHFEHPNYLGMRRLFAEHGVTGATVMKYRIDAAAPVYSAQRVPTASFD